MLSKFFKSKQKFIVALSALFLVITLATGSFAYASGGMAAIAAQDEKGSSSQADETPDGEGGEEQADETPLPDAANFRAPGEMRGAFLVPGVDFLTGGGSESAIKKEVDAALKSAQELTVNSIIVDTGYNDQVIYHSQDSQPVSADFDILGYIVEAARERDFYTYAIFDASVYRAADGDAVDLLSGNLGEFAATYALDGILIDGYTSSTADASYSDYLEIGGAMGLGNFMRQTPAATVKAAAAAIRKNAPATQVGLLSDAVWENGSKNPAGSATEASYTALSSGNADTKGFVEKGLVDFVALKAYTSTVNKSEPFDQVVSWWSHVAESSQIPLYVVHATDKLFSQEEGWNSKDQLVQQVSTAQAAGVAGSIFNDLKALAANPQDVATNLLKFYDNEYTPAKAETPAAATPQQTPAPAPAPAPTPAPVPAAPAASTDDEDDGDVAGIVEGGEEDTGTEADTDEVSDIDDWETETAENDTADTSSSSTADSTNDTDTDEPGDGFVWEVNYGASSVTPQTIPLVKNLGEILVNESYTGAGLNMMAGLQTVAASKFTDGDVIQVTADQAITYSSKTKDSITTPGYYPLPKGTVDTVVGKEFSYYSAAKKKTYYYVVLKSGLRVETKDIETISGKAHTSNKITGLGIKSDKDFTYITLNNSQRPAYTVKYTSTGISFTFKNTADVSSSKNLSKNPMFTKATLSGKTLTLDFVKSGGFMGYKGYYNKSGNLVLRFNNPPADIKGARIAVDPGHGGKDPGNLATNHKYDEHILNKQIAKEVVAELESRGATVLLLDVDNIQGPERKAMAEKWQADLLVSVHCNSAPNKAAAGTEVFYFYPFNKTMAANASKAVSSAMSTNNRGAKGDIYNVTLSPQFQSVLVECGFMSNAAELKKLVNTSYHKKIAVGIADSLEATIKSSYTGISGTGSGSASSGSSSSSSSSTTTSNVALEGVWIRDSINIIRGKSTTLAPTFYPEEIVDAPVTWKSSNTSIVTVDENGKITGKAEGTAKITVTAKDGGESSVCEVTVKSSDARGVSVKNIYIKEDLLLSVNEVHVLEADIDPYDADDTSVSWSSSRSSVASVNAAGKVTALKEGETTITATSTDGRKKATCVVTVQGVSGTGSTATGSTEDSGIALSSANSAEFDEFDVTVYPGNAVRLEIVSGLGEVIRGKDFKWESEDTSIATVDAKGYVTGKKVGETYIYATAKDYDLEIEVIVSRDKVKATGVSLEKRSVTVVRRKTVKLTATVSPASATNRAVVWSSSDSKIAKVDGTGTITGVKEGTATITVKTKDGNYTDKCTVTVVNSSIKIEDIYMEDTLDIYVGETDKLVPELDPEDATSSDLIWKSSRPEIATVDDKGNIKAIKKGTTTITVTAKENTKAKATCRVTVQD